MKKIIQTCIDFDVRQHRLHAAMRHAIREYQGNHPAVTGTEEHAVIESFMNHPGKILTPDHTAMIQRMALITGKMWNPGRTLKICFLDGGAIQKKKVIAHAKRWLNYANIKFRFVSGQNATIRISFRAGFGSWSTIGTDAFSVSPDEPTMNFGWLKATTAEEEYKRVVVHEFGHVLGCIHEHQSPAGNIHWNKPVVYKYFEGFPNNWTKEEIDHNLFEKYSKNITQFSQLDPESIMMYPIPKAFTLDGFEVAMNKTLSPTDIRFIEEKYPR